MNQTFSQEEAQEILTRAVHRQAQDEHTVHGAELAESGRVTDAQLDAMASELGIPSETVRQVQSEWQRSRAEELDRKAYDKHVRGDWLSHVTAYVIVNGFLLAMDLFTAHQITWSIFPLLGWGIGLAFDTASTFIRSDDDYEKGFRRWRKKRSVQTDDE